MSSPHEFKRLPRVGHSRATLRANLTARESATDARRFGALKVSVR